MVNYFIFIFLSFITFISAQAMDKKTKSFINYDCIKNDSCDLKSFSIDIYKSFESEPRSNSNPVLYASTFLEGKYEVGTEKSIKEYAVVQSIKGCVYQKNQKDDEPETIYKGGTTRDFFGEKINFRHENLVIDSFDDDPIYASYSEQNDRHGLYRLKKDESISLLFTELDDNDEFLFFSPEIIKPIIHFSDMPTGSRYSEGLMTGGELKGKINKSLRLASMEFKTCIYKTKDVPRNLGPNDTDRTKAIACLNWNNSHKLNKARTAFEDRKSLDSNCLRSKK